jgi:hypothetical protein
MAGKLTVSDDVVRAADGIVNAIDQAVGILQAAKRTYRAACEEEDRRELLESRVSGPVPVDACRN